MKVASFKTLIVSVLSGILVIASAMSIDDITDILWVLFLGYLTFKGLKTALSQEEYEKDARQAAQKRALYLKLFGAFAFIAGDIPMLLLLLMCALAYFCPVTLTRTVILCILLAASVGYAVWINWYISKHEKMRFRNGEPEPTELSAAEKQAWKRSDFCHGILYFIIAAFLLFYFIFGDPMIYRNNAKLKSAVTALNTNAVTLEEMVPFDWTAVYSFAPYYPLENIEQITGSESPSLNDSVNEGMINVVFMNHGRVAASICKYPSDLGYSLDFTNKGTAEQGPLDGGYSCIEYGEGIAFEVTKEHGIVYLR